MICWSGWRGKEPAACDESRSRNSSTLRPQRPVVVGPGSGPGRWRRVGSAAYPTMTVALSHIEKVRMLCNSPPGSVRNNDTDATGRRTMRSTIAVVSSLAVMFCVGHAAMAQQATPAAPANAPSGGTPDAMPFDIPYGQSIGADKAKQILSAAEAEAKKRNWKMNIAVVDTNGELVHFL